jgi:hypothetical protein
MARLVKSKPKEPAKFVAVRGEYVEREAATEAGIISSAQRFLSDGRIYCDTLYVYQLVKIVRRKPAPIVVEAVAVKAPKVGAA